MSRVKRGVTSRLRHKKVVRQAKGYYGARSRVYRVAKQAVIRAGQYSYRDRRQRKRQFRRLWITRISAAVRGRGMRYSEFMHLLRRSSVTINRKILSESFATDSFLLGSLLSKLGIGETSHPHVRVVGGDV